MASAAREISLVFIPLIEENDEDFRDLHCGAILRLILQRLLIAEFAYVPRQARLGIRLGWSSCYPHPGGKNDTGFAAAEIGDVEDVGRTG
jgi:hypothetical protein